MQSQPHEVSFPVPLGYTAHQVAVNFAKQQADQRKAKQIQLNTLSVYTVMIYLKCMGFETDLSTSDSWNPILHSLMNTADLQLPNIGKLECRPVSPLEQCVYVPPEVWSERIGYVVVQLNHSLSSGLLIGFTKSVITEQFPLDGLSSVPDLLEHLDQVRQAKMQVKISQWFENNFTDGWQPTQELFSNHSRDLAHSIRSKEPFLTNEFVDAEREVSGSKLIDLGIQIHKHPLALVVTVTSTTNREKRVLVQIRPLRGQHILPQGIELIVFDETGNSMNTTAREQDECIQLRFTGELGEQFSAKVTFKEASLTEKFFI